MAKLWENGALLQQTSRPNTKLPEQIGRHCFLTSLHLIHLRVNETQTNSDFVYFVSAGPVILESPVHPVTEGSSVTLTCRQRHTDSSYDLTAHFYKDSVYTLTRSTGVLSLHNISTSHEGLYSCEVDGLGKSPQSWLSIAGEGAGSFGKAQFRILFYQDLSQCCHLQARMHPSP